ncbi:hypothetical protein [Clostridium saccharobutylicum]|uniref:Uncharacterized protein n=1 Tax=Clostridium saccharobutylicum DSM 13864 TaxID=1345695 RepID=U5MTW6_CLOSA|nr:hypothetical protein [Clostridium saccharobutylicum]AGX43958.1 hypothetical protein CLSA_c29910 [Clostridium saccharobutylicum DSM 13864]AQR91255.1 hypothetical protein CLOSC_29790 [Clostridium saccharobutylicum]AQS01159.1 hypothetical protein CSACC_29860 [Clostridium saccharobutylicum]AQS10572.1 hypothetical protein CLOBY_27170 [Clostridium saccharobutylicum]AQS15142.1 hypothetical protein CLOSACC_29860 [Clostridium saccharobutylicum]
MVTFTDEDYDQMAIQAIKEYKNKDFTDDEIRNKYPLAIKLIIENIKQSLTIDRNIKSETQGPRSRTYKDDVVLIDGTVRVLLGAPYIRMY